MGCFKPSCCRPPEPGLSRRQRRKALRSPARRTGFPAVGHENIPSHCPCSYHRESLCSAGDNVNSYPGNRGKQLGLFGILHGAAACLPREQGPAGPGRRRFSGAITNLPHRPLAGHRAGKSVAAQGKNLYLRQTNVVAEGCGVVCGVGDFTPASSPEAQGPVLTLKGQAAAMVGARAGCMAGQGPGVPLGAAPGLVLARQGLLSKSWPKKAGGWHGRLLPPLHCRQAVLVRPAWGGQQVQGLHGFILSAPAGALGLTLVAEAGRAQPCMSPKAQKWLGKGGRGALSAPTSLPGGRWDALLLQKRFYLYSEHLCHALRFL